MSTAVPTTWQPAGSGTVTSANSGVARSLQNGTPRLEQDATPRVLEAVVVSGATPTAWSTT